MRFDSFRRVHKLRLDRDVRAHRKHEERPGDESSAPREIIAEIRAADRRRVHAGRESEPASGRNPSLPSRGPDHRNGDETGAHESMKAHEISEWVDDIRASS